MSSKTDYTRPPTDPVEAEIIRVGDDVCELNLGEYGHGRLRQEQSKAWKSGRPLRELRGYRRGARIRVILQRWHHTPSGRAFWFVHERWAEENPWPDLECRLPGDRVVTGVIQSRAPHGWFVQLDQVDIEALLPERCTPWTDGSTTPEPRVEHSARLAFEIGDRIKARLTQIRRPPEAPLISVNALLDLREQEQDQWADSPPPARTDPAFQLRNRARISGNGLNALLARLRQNHPLKGKRLLLIDDDIKGLDALTDLLRLNGATVDVLHAEKYPSLGELAEAASERNTRDLYLIDYSLPHQGEGLTLAHRLKRRIPAARIALYTGEVVEVPGIKATPELVGVLRKPIRLDSLLRCLEGEAVWEVAGLSPLNAPPEEPSGQRENPAQLIRGLFLRLKHLRYLVLLRPLSADAVVREVVQGRFPADEDLPTVVQVSDLSSLLKGYRKEFGVGGDNPGNDALKRYSQYALFKVIGEGKPPSFVLGAGWDSEHPPFAAQDFDAFLTLLEARLEHAALIQWVHERLPFIVLGQVFVGLGHEINNRFGPWIQHQETLKLAWQTHVSADDTRRPALAAQIDRSLEGMDAAFNGLHDLVDLMLTRLRTRDGPSRVSDLLAELRRLFEPQLRTQGIRYIVDGTGPKCWLGLPALYIIQPLSNLVLNVQKHMHREHGGWVRVHSDLAAGGDVLEITVEDNGPGIPHAVMPRLFEPGFSLAPHPGQRTGMGLYVSRLLLAEIGGAVECDWTWRGVGTRFRIEVPLQLERSGQ
jgi:signal transduction histidine kinase/ActR/RegA family two-component response regulator